MRRVAVLACLAVVAVFPSSSFGDDRIEAGGVYAEVARRLDPWVAAEVEGKDLPALSIALVDGDKVVWARGFGFADPGKKLPATADTAYRVGSVSKLFTDLALMQLVEQGMIDLDASIHRLIPEFSPKNPYKVPITLRQLMSHRAGLVREPPAGHYFDPTPPDLSSVVQSLNPTQLIYKPGTRTKYSNAGVTVVGLAVEKARGEPFAVALKKSLLDPLGMPSTSFEPDPALTARMAKGQMWTYDGQTIACPTFLLGTGPAGNLVSTVNDLGKFLVALFHDGGGILQPATFRAMLDPQFAKPGESPGFGLGFALSTFEGRRRIGHGGAIYGYATEVSALPDEKLGVVVIATKDCGNGATRHIADVALRLALAAKEGKPLPTPESSTPVDDDRARNLIGHYTRDSTSFDITKRGDRLYLNPFLGGQRTEIRLLSGKLVIDDALTHAPFPAPEGDTLTFGKARFTKGKAEKPSEIPASWEGLIGEYGWDHDVLYIHERDGQLHALIEWFYDYPLTEAGPDRFLFPDRGLYDGEALLFSRDAGGHATKVDAASVVFHRRKVGGGAGSTFKITPRRPIETIRAEIAGAKPPAETGEFRKADLIDLTTLDPSIKLDIRYAGTNNFVGVPFYNSSRAYLQRPAAGALLKAHKALAKAGYGLLIHDAYRPWRVTKLFWEVTPDSGRNFVADPAKGSKHNRGSAVDLTLYDLATGKPAVMVGGYDEMSPRSYPDYPGGTSLQRWQRDLLRDAMEAEGFTVNEFEWWHFDHEDWAKYPILDVPFENLK